MATDLALVNSPADDMDAAVRGFLNYCRAKNLSDNTAIYYSYRLKSFQQYLAYAYPGLAPRDVTPQVVRGFVTVEAAQKSPSTANHSVVTLKAFFNYLLMDGFIKASPMSSIQKLRQRKTVVETFSIEQVQAVLKTCHTDFLGVRDRAIIIILFDCGLRASELCGLCIGDISWSDQTMLIVGKGDKERRVPFGQAAKQALLKYVSRRTEVQTESLFVTCYGDPLNRIRLADMVQNRCRKAGIQGVRCSPHTLRHTFAVSYLRAGGDVFSLQKILGHSDLTMTRRYAELSQTDVQDKHRLYSPADRIGNTAPKTGRVRLK